MTPTKQIACLWVELNAWHSAFGTSQLTHAAERLRVAEAEVLDLRRQVAELHKDIGCLAPRWKDQK
jgi:hypothetical protein